ncbi:hypothetical protein GGI23_002297 [Coemansia sp. RSA 2559]|nr:hypothetical protein GGI23_002297 [Coemansia sp. RSA 2559]KAJ2863472.1 hypothetical protein GGI22_001943 [Coemansia erecta]
MKEERPEGKLDVRIVAGRNLPRRGFFGRGDSRVDLTLGTSKKQSQVDKKGGSSPEWNDRVHFAVGGLGKTQMHVAAVELDSTISQKTIGTCVIDLTEVFEEEEIDGWYSLTRHDKPAGDVYLEFTFTPKGGRTKPSKLDMSDDEEEENIPQLAPSRLSASGTVASAPIMMQHDLTGSVTSFSAPSISSASTVPALSAPMRPSLSDLRPYSSASMHNPELANKYAQKHGTKPLPMAPAQQQASPAATMDLPLYPTAPHQMVMEYDQTVMPGQATIMQMQQPMIAVAPSPNPYQEQQPMHQQQQLMNLFAPPAVPMDPTQQFQPNKILPAPPQQATPVPTPAYNPAFNPEFAIDPADPYTSQQQQPQSKMLPAPPFSAASSSMQPIDMPMTSLAAPMHIQYQSMPPQPTTMAGNLGGFVFNSVPAQMYQMQSAPQMSQTMMGSAVQYQQHQMVDPQVMEQYNPYMPVSQQSPITTAQQAQYSQVYTSPVPVSQPMYQQQHYQQQQPMQPQIQPQQSLPSQQVVYSSAYSQGQQMAAGAQMIYMDPQQHHYQQPQQQVYQQQQQVYQQQQQQQVYLQHNESVEPSAPMLPVDNGAQPQFLPPQQMYAPNNGYGNQAAY